MVMPVRNRRMPRRIRSVEGLVARGMDSNTTEGFAGAAVEDSRADPHSIPADRDALHGLFEVTTRLPSPYIFDN